MCTNRAGPSFYLKTVSIKTWNVRNSNKLDNSASYSEQKKDLPCGALKSETNLVQLQKIDSSLPKAEINNI